MRLATVKRFFSWLERKGKLVLRKWVYFEFQFNGMSKLQAAPRFSKSLVFQFLFPKVDTTFLHFFGADARDGAECTYSLPFTIPLFFRYFAISFCNQLIFSFRFHIFSFSEIFSEFCYIFRYCSFFDTSNEIIPLFRFFCPPYQCRYSEWWKFDQEFNSLIKISAFLLKEQNKFWKKIRLKTKFFWN